MADTGNKAPEGAPEGLSEEELMGGHPASGGTDAPAAPKMIDVEIGGVKYSVSEEAAAAMKAADDDYKHTIDDLRTTVDSVQRSPIPEQRPEGAPEDDTDWDTYLLTEPAKAMKEFGDRIRSEVIAEVQDQYAADQSSKNFWTSFYNQNPDLQEYDWIVDAVMNKNYAELGPLSPARAADKLADYTKTELLKLTNKSGNKPSANAVVLEGGSANNAPSPNPSPQQEMDADTDAIPDSLVDALKERAARRRGQRKAAT